MTQQKKLQDLADYLAQLLCLHRGCSNQASALGCAYRKPPNGMHLMQKASSRSLLEEHLEARLVYLTQWLANSLVLLGSGKGLNAEFDRLAQVFQSLDFKVLLAEYRIAVGHPFPGYELPEIRMS